ncbi:MAG: bifunctional methylenetetrahydrofolate dehydrogenase/methenyltetrahydrofolate cyclohydrolase FolD [Candidatus Bipolaricaulia bacterium]
MGQIIDGKQLAQKIRDEVGKETAQLKAETGIVPGLAAVLAGEDPASKLYVNMKVKACEEAGIYSETRLLSEEISQQDLVKVIRELNQNEKIHGILVQLPLPDHINPGEILETVAPAKDVDGFHSINLGRLLAAKDIEDISSPVPATPAGILQLINSTKVKIQGKRATVIGRSIIVGKPTALLLLARHATVTLCHSRTQNLADRCREADLLVAAVGQPKLVTGEMVKPGAVVIDVGVHRTEEGLVGDVDFESARPVAGYITPVPGGVGPMTIAMLLRNTLKAAQDSVR